MDKIVREVKDIAATADEAARKKIMLQLRDLSYSLESEEDTAQRIFVRHLEVAVARIGCDLKIFDLLAASEKPMTLVKLQQKTEAAPILLGRVLRYMSSMAMIAEPQRDLFSATNVTRALAVPGNQAGLYHYFDTCGPTFQALPDFLAKTKHQGITDSGHSPFQDAFNTEDSPFVYLAKHPDAAANFNKYMAYYRGGDNKPSWLSVFPFEEETKSVDANSVLFVDMGGNIGHQCAALKSRFPQVPGRVILQDLPHAIGMALQTPGVENTVHDIFQPQPVKDAKFYYMRAVLHDFSDEKCREILRNIIPAMGKESLVLIDEMLFPDQNVHWYATQHDLTMMASLASQERTGGQWDELLKSAGLEMSEAYTYNPSMYESVMVLKLR